MRPRHPHAAESGVGKHTARESESAQACAIGEERVANAHSAACGCLGLMAGPSGPLPVRIFRVRPLRPVRSLPAGSGTPDGVRTRLQRGLSRVCTFATGTAPAFGRPLAPRYGSDLLPLRLPWLLQRGDAFFAPPR